MVRKLSFIIFLLLTFLLSACTHIELPSLPGKDKKVRHHKSRGDTSRVDVSGVGDSVSSQKIVVKRIPFPADEYSALKTSGSATVKGKIHLSYNGTEVVGRQTRLYLNPVTSYSNQWYRESYLAGHKMGKSDPRLFNYLKFTASDGNGNFAFYGVPAGSYYVVGTVKCAECGGKNIRIAKRIRVGSNGAVSVDLSKDI